MRLPTPSGDLCGEGCSCHEDSVPLVLDLSSLQTNSSSPPGFVMASGRRPPEGPGEASHGWRTLFLGMVHFEVLVLPLLISLYFLANDVQDTPCNVPDDQLCGWGDPCNVRVGVRGCWDLLRGRQVSVSMNRAVPVGCAACRVRPTRLTSSSRLWGSDSLEEVTSCLSNSAVPLAASRLVSTFLCRSRVAKSCTLS